MKDHYSNDNTALNEIRDLLKDIHEESKATRRYVEVLAKTELQRGQNGLAFLEGMTGKDYSSRVPQWAKEVLEEMKDA